MRLLCTLLAVSSLAAGQTALVFRNVRVFDGAKMIPSTSVVVDGSRIAAIGPNVAIPPGATTIDGAGKTLLPGLIDAHTHTIVETTLRQALVFGVTTDLDMFTVPETAARIKKQQAEGKLLDYADLRSAGMLATAPGGHGTEYGVPVITLTSPDQAQAWVDARIAEGSDYIKIIYDDGLEYGGKAIPTLSKETMKAVVDAAHKRGKLAVVHIGTLQQAQDAIAAGVDGLAHLFTGATSAPDFGKYVAEHHAFVVATLTVLNTICGTKFDGELANDPHLKPYLPPDAIAEMKQSFGPRKVSCAGASEAVKQLKAAGVPILAGTDAGNPGTTQGASLHGELELLVAAGLTPLEALRAATSAPAAAFHLDDRGRIAPGLRADLVLVQGDPATDIRATRDIVSVWKAGHEVDRAKWKASIEEQMAQEAKRRELPAPAGSESGWVSDFEEGGATPQAKYGAGWMVTTDKMAGGKSVGDVKIVPGGANGSKNALLVTGEVIQGFAFPWSGVMFSPGAAPMSPANLSSKKAIHFWAKGDGQTYEVMIFDQKLGYRPATKSFVAGPEWKEFNFTWADFGLDGSGIMGIAWTAGPKLGTYELRLDEVRIQ